jgi:hypothetical protein
MRVGESGFHRRAYDISGRLVGPALLVTLDADQYQSTMELNAKFLRPVRPGRILAKGRVARRDGDLAFLQATLYDHSGQTIATATVTARVIPLGAGRAVNRISIAVAVRCRRQPAENLAFDQNGDKAADRRILELGPGRTSQLLQVVVGYFAGPGRGAQQVHDVGELDLARTAISQLLE